MNFVALIEYFQFRIIAYNILQHVFEKKRNDHNFSDGRI